MSALFTIERLAYSGRRTRHEVSRSSKNETFEIDSGSVGAAPEIVRAASLKDLLASSPKLNRVTRGAVWITCDGGVEVHDLLGRLHVVDPSNEPAVPDRWGQDGELPDELNVFSEEDDELDLDAWGGLDLIPRWVRLNGRRVVIARDARRAAALLLDGDFDPVITEQAFSWGFYGESGGPCSWDGGSAAGWCGPALWIHHRWGDLEPHRFVDWAPPAKALTAFLADGVQHNKWELTFVRGVVGMPGLAPEEVAAIEQRSYIEGDWLDSHLSGAVDARVLRELCKRQPDLRPAVHALRHPRSERGSIVYAWLRDLGRQTAAASWLDVDEALRGGRDLPPEPEEADEAVPRPPAPTFIACPRRGTHSSLEECWMCTGDVLAGRITERQALGGSTSRRDQPSRSDT